MSTTRNMFSVLKNVASQGFARVKSGMTAFASIRAAVQCSAFFMLSGLLQLADTACNEKLEGVSLEDYYNEAYRRIAWLVLSSLILGSNLKYVMETWQADTDHEHGPHADQISAKKVWAICTTVYSGHYFIGKALSTPITGDNAIYILCSTAINGPLWGTLRASGGYVLQKLNYSILSFTSAQVKLLGMGVAVSILQEFLDFFCNQKIAHDDLQWDSLISPRRLLALHVYNSIVQGFIYGISLCNLKKYSKLERPQEDGVFLKMRNIILSMHVVILPMGTFIQKALTVPIYSKNAGIIMIADSLATGIPNGLVLASSMIVLLNLQISDSNRNQEEKVRPPLPEYKETPPINSSLFGSGSINRNSEHVDVLTQLSSPSLPENKEPLLANSQFIEGGDFDLARIDDAQRDGVSYFRPK